MIKPFGPGFEKALERLTKAHPEAQAVECDSTQQALPIARSSGRCLVLLYCSEQDHIVKAATLIKMVREQSRGMAIRVVVMIKFPGSLGDIIDEKLQAIGAHEVIREPIAERALVFKLERHLKVLPGAKKKGDEAGKPAADKNGLRAQELDAAGSRGSKADELRLVTPLDFMSDCFMIVKGGTKRVGGRWIVRLVAPGPLAGRWIEAGSSGGDSRFRWLPHDPERDSFIQDAGAWVFTGVRMPEFVQEMWTFAGKKPRLEFVDNEGKVLARKFGIAEDGALEIAKDSQVAQQQLQKIRVTFEKVIRSEEGDPLAESAEATEGAKKAGRSAQDYVERRKKAVEGDEPEAIQEAVLGKELLYREKREEHGLDIEDRQGDEEEPGGGPADAVQKARRAMGKDRKFESEEREVDEPLSVELEAQEHPDWEKGDLSREKREQAMGRRKGDSAEASDADTGEESADRSGSQGSESSAAERDGGSESIKRGFEKSESAKKTSRREESAADENTGAQQSLERQARQASKTVGAAQVTDYLYPVESFGTPGGEWELACRDPETGDRCFVYVALELMNAVSSVEELERYFTFVGERRPVLTPDQKEWVFREAHPRHHDTFDALRTEVRDYLKERAPRKLQNPDAAAAEAEEPSQPREKQGKSQSEADPPEEVAREAHEKIRDEVRERMAKAAAEPDAAAAKEAQSPEKSRVPRGTPSGPTLGPLALAFLMSELLANRKKYDLASAARRYCEYVANSCGVERVELWLMSASGWQCVGASGEETPAGKLGFAFAGVDPGSIPEQGPRLHDGKAWVGWVGGKSAPVRGALVLAGAELETMRDGYPSEAAAVTWGLLLRQAA